MTKLVAVALLLAGCASAEEQLAGGGFDFSVAAGDDFAAAPDDLARRSNGDGGVIGTCPPTQHLEINEVKTGGTASASDEFVELFNPCAVDVDLTGYSLVYRSAAGTTDVLVVSLTKTIASGGYFLVAGPTYSNGATPDQTYGSGRLAATGGGLALRDATQAIIDSVGYGNATNMFVEGAAAAAPPNDQSLARTPNGVDSNHNDLDFSVAASPTPRAAN